MDFVGVLMRYVTIPMALLSVAALAGTMFLALSGDYALVLVAVAAFAIGIVAADVAERVAILFDCRAWATVGRAGRRQGMIVGTVSAALPMGALLVWEYLCFRFFAHSAGQRPVARFLLSYGVATGPWTAYALTVGSDRRTLCGIRAYAGHLGYWLMTGFVLAGAPLPVAGLTMLVPAILPLSVGILLAVGDREALVNVRI